MKSSVKSLYLEALTVTPMGNFDTVVIHAYRGVGFIIIGGYFKSSTGASGDVATISGCNVPDASDFSVACQCDDGSVKWVAFGNSGSDLVVKAGGAPLTANKYVRFTASLPIS